MIYFLFFKYYADMENCESFRGFGYIYIYIYTYIHIYIYINLREILYIILINSRKMLCL